MFLFYIAHFKNPAKLSVQSTVQKGEKFAQIACEIFHIFVLFTHEEIHDSHI
jgi:hypothetical protein